MHRRLTNRSQAVYKEIKVPAMMKEPVMKDQYYDDHTEISMIPYSEKHLPESEISEMENTNSQLVNCNYTVVQKIPLLFTVEEMEKGLENSTRCLFKMGEIQKDENICLKIKIKKRIIEIK